jgi:hypothetical protein
MKPLADSNKNHKALNKGAWHWVCWTCDAELRARGVQDSMDVWMCPTAADGELGCKCCCKPKQAAPSGKRKAGGQGFSSSKLRKWKKRYV